MAKFKQLRDLYRFPGFVPVPTIRGVFGDSQAVVIHLQRRRKKLSVASAARSIAVTTTSDHDGFAISLVGTNASIWSSCSAGSNVPGVEA
jgi:hypothetical protein